SVSPWLQRLSHFGWTFEKTGPCFSRISHLPTIDMELPCSTQQFRVHLCSSDGTGFPYIQTALPINPTRFPSIQTALPINPTRFPSIQTASTFVLAARCGSSFQLPSR